MNDIQMFTPLPTALSQQQMRAALNNRLAQAYASGDPRFAVKEFDRPGFSRGGAQWNQAGISAAQNLSQGIADAYSQDLQNNAFNANAGLQAAAAQEQQAQALGGLNQQNAYANQMAALQRQNQILGLLGGLLR